MRPYFFFALTAVMLYLIVMGLTALHWLSVQPSYTLQIILFLFFITMLIYRYIARFSSAGPEAITRFYLLSIVLKLLAGCTLISVLVITDKAGAFGNAVLFLLGYILFTVVEIIFLLRLKKE